MLAGKLGNLHEVRISNEILANLLDCWIKSFDFDYADWNWLRTGGRIMSDSDVYLSLSLDGTVNAFSQGDILHDRPDGDAFPNKVSCTLLDVHLERKANSLV